MRYWITRFLLLLITANVVYGTHGDVYADQVQGLINPLNTHISYTPDINTDLFFATKCKDSRRADRLFIKSHRNLQEWAVVVFPVLEPANAVKLAGNSDEVAYITHRIVRKLIFPHHFFS